MANLACYPAINVPNGFIETGSPTNVTFYARPFGEMELIALAKAYQDAAGFHLKRPDGARHLRIAMESGNWVIWYRVIDWVIA